MTLDGKQSHSEYNLFIPLPMKQVSNYQSTKYTEYTERFDCPKLTIAEN